jgi:hypothetical protein
LSHEMFSFSGWYKLTGYYTVFAAWPQEET